GVARLERQRLELPGLNPPHVDEFPQPLGFLFGQVVAFARVAAGVEQLPALTGELTPRVRRRRAQAGSLPPAVPQGTFAKHRVELRLLPGVRAGILEAGRETDAFQGFLRVAVHGLR